MIIMINGYCQLDLTKELSDFEGITEVGDYSKQITGEKAEEIFNILLLKKPIYLVIPDNPNGSVDILIMNWISDYGKDSSSRRELEAYFSAILLADSTEGRVVYIKISNAYDQDGELYIDISAFALPLGGQTLTNH